MAIWVCTHCSSLRLGDSAEEVVDRWRLCSEDEWLLCSLQQVSSDCLKPWLGEKALAAIRNPI